MYFDYQLKKTDPYIDMYGKPESGYCFEVKTQDSPVPTRLCRPKTQYHNNIEIFNSFINTICIGFVLIILYFKRKKIKDLLQKVMERA